MTELQDEALSNAALAIRKAMVDAALSTVDKLDMPRQDIMNAVLNGSSNALCVLLTAFVAPADHRAALLHVMASMPGDAERLQSKAAGLRQN